MSRTSTCTPEIVEAVCALLEEGKTLSEACKAAGLTKRTWLRWSDADEKIAQEYNIALRARAEAQEAEIDRIRLTAKDKDSAAAARVQIDTLKWTMARMAPQRYGERVELSVDHKVDLGSIIEARRQRVLEENERLGLPNGGEGREGR